MIYQAPRTSSLRIHSSHVHLEYIRSFAQARTTTKREKSYSTFTLIKANLWSSAFFLPRGFCLTAHALTSSSRADLIIRRVMWKQPIIIEPITFPRESKKKEKRKKNKLFPPARSSTPAEGCGLKKCQSLSLYFFSLSLSLLFSYFTYFISTCVRKSLRSSVIYIFLFLIFQHHGQRQLQQLHAGPRTRMWFFGLA